MRLPSLAAIAIALACASCGGSGSPTSATPPSNSTPPPPASPPLTSVTLTRCCPASFEGLQTSITDRAGSARAEYLKATAFYGTGGSGYTRSIHDTGQFSTSNAAVAQLVGVAGCPDLVPGNSCYAIRLTGARGTASVTVAFGGMSATFTVTLL
jgi:hypothetical protein